MAALVLIRLSTCPAWISPDLGTGFQGFTALPLGKSIITRDISVAGLAGIQAAVATFGADCRNQRKPAGFNAAKANAPYLGTREWMKTAASREEERAMMEAA